MEEEFKKRINALNSYNVRLVAAGRVKVNNINILGKGHASIVIKGYLDDIEVAVKMRRMDSKRKDMSNEAYNLRLANSIGIGPRLFYANDDMLIMEYVDGEHIGEFLKRSDHEVRPIIIDILNQCFKLDSIHLDHGELSRMDRHVIVNEGAKIIDFDSASRERRVANLTSAVHYLIKSNKFDIERGYIFRALREYKQCICNDCFNRLLTILKIK